MYRILLVEDDAGIREVVKDYIEEKGKSTMGIFTACDGKSCEKKLKRYSFDLILLDVMLPDTDGFELCRMIRRDNSVPIVFLTARGSEEDILWGYGLGCDDYVVKPFSLAELYAKILAILRRAGGELENDVLVCGGVRLDKKSFIVYADGREITLQKKQYEMLRFLMEHRGVVWSRNSLLDHIWGYDYCGTDRVVDNQIKNLRQALGSAGSCIKTVIGQGYKMEG